jgi:hypothetical protein
MLEIFAILGSGLLYESTSVFWTHYSERGNATGAAICSGIQALALVFGVGESVSDWHLAPYFVLGYALGSFLAVKVKGKIGDGNNKK